ncbi:MAG: hypothetical protein ACRENE_30830, partial [Polyangiaceae bacterium]
ERALHPAGPGPEHMLAEAELREQKAELLRRLTAECAGDPDALAVIDCALLAIEQPEEQARVTGVSYADVRSAIKRVTRRMERLQRAEGTVAGDE